MPGSARIGAIEASGLDGPITIARAFAIAASACSLGVACSAPRNSRPSTIPCARSRIMNSWNELHPSPPRTHVRTGSSLIGSTRARTPIASFSRASAAVGERPSSAHIRARSRHQARSRSPRLNHTSHAERAQRVHDRERVLAQTPAALVDQIAPARTRRGPGPGRRARRRSRCHRRCWRSQPGARCRSRRPCPARAWRRRCPRRERRYLCSSLPKYVRRTRQAIGRVCLGEGAEPKDPLEVVTQKKSV